MTTRRLVSALGAAVLLAAGGLATAPSASAVGTWFQSVGRASATAPCPDDSFGTPWQSNWDPSEQTWRPSWGQWMNGGMGGFTCDRNITWAKSSYPSAGCLRLGLGGYVNFAGGWAIGVGPEYSDASCSIVSASSVPNYVVYAPAPWDGPTLCREAFGSLVTVPGRYAGTDVWTCAGVG